MNAYQLGYITGILVVFAVIFFCIAFAYKLKRKHGAVKEEFDERQLMERGNAFKYGFFTYMVESALYLFVVAGKFEPFLQLGQGFITILGLFIPLTVFAFYAITHDAFMAYNVSGRRSYMLYILVFVINLVSGIGNIASGHIYDDGEIGVGAINILMAVLFGAILIALFIRSRMNRE